MKKETKQESPLDGKYEKGAVPEKSGLRKRGLDKAYAQVESYLIECEEKRSALERSEKSAIADFTDGRMDIESLIAVFDQHKVSEAKLSLRENACYRALYWVAELRRKQNMGAKREARGMPDGTVPGCQNCKDNVVLTGTTTLKRMIDAVYNEAHPLSKRNTFSECGAARTDVKSNAARWGETVFVYFHPEYNRTILTNAKDDYWGAVGSSAGFKGEVSIAELTR